MHDPAQISKRQSCSHSVLNLRQLVSHAAATARRTVPVLNSLLQLAAHEGTKAALLSRSRCAPPHAHGRRVHRIARRPVPHHGRVVLRDDRRGQRHALVRRRRLAAERRLLVHACMPALHGATGKPRGANLAAPPTHRSPQRGSPRAHGMSAPKRTIIGTISTPEAAQQRV
jgi:hypothetical protein